jgi:hypothetical protein
MAKINGNLTINGDLSCSISNLMPVGSIILWVLDSAPGPDFLECNGATYAKTGPYAALYQALGSAYSVDANTFRIPDLRQKFPIGSNATFPLASSRTGVQHTHTIPTHDHQTMAHTHLWDSHTHGLGNHTHNASHLHEIAAHGHSIAGTHSHPIGTHVHSFTVQSSSYNGKTAGSGSSAPVANHTHTGGTTDVALNNTGANINLLNDYAAHTNGTTPTATLSTGPSSGGTQPPQNVNSGTIGGSIQGPSPATSAGGQSPYFTLKYFIRCK